MSMNSDSRTDERRQVLPLLLKAHRQRAAGLDQHVVQSRLAGQLVPGPIGVQEDEAQVVHVAVVLAVFEQPAVMLGPLAPGGIGPAADELPHHPGEESAGPIGPQFALVMPTPAGRVDRKIVGRSLRSWRRLAARQNPGPGHNGRRGRRSWLEWQGSHGDRGMKPVGSSWASSYRRRPGRQSGGAAGEPAPAGRAARSVDQAAACQVC